MKYLFYLALVLWSYETAQAGCPVTPPTPIFSPNETVLFRNESSKADERFYEGIVLNSYIDEEYTERVSIQGISQNKKTSVVQTDSAKVYKTSGCLENVCVGSREACFATNEPFNYPYVPTEVAGINPETYEVVYFSFGDGDYTVEDLKTAKKMIEVGCYTCKEKGPPFFKKRVCEKRPGF